MKQLEILKKEKQLHTQDLIDKNLLLPLQEFFLKPGKNIRSQVVELGHRLSLKNEQNEFTRDEKEKIELAGSIVELIHAGSLIVDDIQDGSVVRRDAPTLHLSYGMPIALNAGNCLYFSALAKVRDLNLLPEEFSKLMNDLLDFMIKAHMGQAIDLGTPIDEVPLERIPDVAHSSMQLKTGVLLNFALRLGAATSESHWRGELIKLGNDLGLILQMFDDFSSLALPKTHHPSKRHEDLILKRPSWVWAEVSLLGATAFNEFKFAVNKLPDEDLLNAWIEKNNFIAHLWQQAQSKVQKIKSGWIQDWKETHPETLKILMSLCDQLENSYVKKH